MPFGLSLSKAIGSSASLTLLFPRSRSANPLIPFGLSLSKTSVSGGSTAAAGKECFTSRYANLKPRIAGEERRRLQTCATGESNDEVADYKPALAGKNQE